MKREEQIEQKAKELGQKYFPDEYNIWARPNYEAQYVEYACKEMMKWADEHPKENPLEGILIHGNNDAYRLGYKDAIDNVCEWVEKFAYNSVVTDNIGEREKQAIVTSFKEYMEEQQ